MRMMMMMMMNLNTIAPNAQKVNNINQNPRSQTAMESVRSFSKLSTESIPSAVVGDSCELRTLFTPPTPTRLNATAESRRWCVLGIISQLTHLILHYRTRNTLDCDQSNYYSRIVFSHIPIEFGQTGISAIRSADL